MAGNTPWGKGLAAPSPAFGIVSRDSFPFSFSFFLQSLFPPRTVGSEGATPPSTRPSSSKGTVSL